MRGQWAGGIRRNGSSPLWVLTFESGLESNMLFTSASLAFGERVPNPSTAICSRPRGLIGVAGVIRGSGRSGGWVGFITVSVGRPVPAGGLGCSVVVTLLLLLMLLLMLLLLLLLFVYSQRRLRVSDV